MRRADRLFQIIQLLRRRRLATAARLAEELEVSERTIYRDIRDLTISGVPIDGEAGVGYVLRRGFDLPPLMFTDVEIESLVLGARIVGSWGDAPLANAAQDVLAKVEAVVPERLKARMQASPLFAPGFHVPQQVVSDLAALRPAIDARWKVHLAYTKEDGIHSVRTVRPLGLFFWGSVWSLTAWCELRRDFRNFRLDRVETLEVLRERFLDEPGKMLADYLRKVGDRP